MKTYLRFVNDHGTKYQALLFSCPGCAEIASSGTGLNSLTVNSTERSPSWDFDGNVEFPTLSPSIRVTHGDGKICHSFLRAGIFEFLDDCGHSLAGQRIPLPDLPTWGSFDLP